MRPPVALEAEATPFTHDKRHLVAVEKWVAYDERKGGSAFHFAAHQPVEQLLPAGQVGGVKMGRKQVRFQPASVGNMVPAVVVDHQKLRVSQLHEVIGIDDVFARLGAGGNVLGTPVLVIEAPDDNGRVRFAQRHEAEQLGAVVLTAAWCRAVRAGYFHPQQQSDFIGQVINAWVDAGNVHPHQVAAQGFHGVHVPLHFFERGLAWLVKNAVEVSGFVVEVYVAAPGLNFAQPK